MTVEAPRAFLLVGEGLLALSRRECQNVVRARGRAQPHAHPIFCKRRETLGNFGISCKTFLVSNRSYDNHGYLGDWGSGVQISPLRLINSKA